MREYILERINFWRGFHPFKKNTMRWEDCYVIDGKLVRAEKNSKVGIHLGEADLSLLDDKALVDAFELIMRRSCIMM